MYGDLGNKLVQHAKRTQTLPQLPPYQNEIVRAIVREVRELDGETKRTIARHTSQHGSLDPSIDQGIACALLVNHLFLRRNKRCLLAYHRVRSQKLEELAWRGGDLMDEQQIQTLIDQEHGNPSAIKSGRVQIVDALSPEEEEYFRQYTEMLVAYKGHWTDIDLTGSMEPPKELFVDVRVLKDAGEIQTEYGSINLTKNSQFFVRLGDVEHLIAQGYLQRLD
ncbi:DNA replication complex GINS protein psf1 [Ascosphaera apis ARSEF 7405]|uniref:DNA replication complex GINS protein PSF1 n=1 Tax=Ascosphaera apis ARSEF 7405 TaxID=392613 RepID=A0A168CDA1_9EURO|nr:DNA replication complex GINS protein psf1 [Ascosphaera apis ARSEF 7405]